ncbi:TfuA-like protein [Sorangium sp. So ce388]|uniref:TfuA-like protein n=1 Tax=Sorangium sp. So ce388 TaxID=3133309 RepID=UPI003F5C03CE
MKIYVFAGPTLSAEEARAELDAIYLPPVAQGDLYRASLERPVAIGIVDGYFERVPAVWHKEILSAMGQGIHVFGSASMGALRAAELASFGMEGVGVIYEAFARNELEDDDEVAVAHGPAEEGYRPLSEAMVNIRSTLRAAVAAGALTEMARAALERIAKELFYTERTWPHLLQRGLTEGLPKQEIDSLLAFLPSGRVNQKRLDAIAMLRTMRARLEPGIAPKQVRYHFQHTDAWEQARRAAGGRTLGSAGARSNAGVDGEVVPHDSLVEELRVAGVYARVRAGSMTRALAAEIAQQHNAHVPPEALRDAAESLCLERGLRDEHELRQWAREQRVVDLERLLLDEARRRWAEAMFEPDAAESIPDYLRVSGEYAMFASRALDKQRELASGGTLSPSLADVGAAEVDLFRWYFEERLRGAVPDDLALYARAAGFDDVDAMRRAVLRELIYARRVAAREGEQTAASRLSARSAPEAP